MDRGDQLDVPGLVMEQVAQRFFLKKYQFQPCVLFICTTASAAIYVFLLFYIKASWRSSFTVVNKAFMPKY